MFNVAVSQNVFSNATGKKCTSRYNMENIPCISLIDNSLNTFSF